MSKRYFISHSSADKPLAIGVKNELGGDAWVDLHEIELGDILLQKISEGIEAASDFVLLWSVASAKSRWVQFEFHMAFIRWLEDQAVALRIVCLDDTPVPLHFKPFLQGRGATTAGEVVAIVSGVSPKPVVRRSFFNRNVEIAAIEDTLYDANISCIWLCGIPGVGKKSLAREAIHRLTAGTSSSRRISIAPGIAEPELNLLVASSLTTNPAGEFDALDDIAEHTAKLLIDFSSTGGIWVFEEAEHWLEDDGTFGRLAIQVLQPLLQETNASGRLAVFTSRRRPKVSGVWSERIKSTFVNGLAAHHALPLLRSKDGTGSDAELTEVANALDGHPFALEIIAPLLPVNAATLGEHRYTIATDLLDPEKLSANTWRMLEVLAIVDGHVATDDLTAYLSLNSEDFQYCVAESTSYSLVEYSEVGYLSLHPLLRDYFLRSYRKDPDSAQKTAELAELSRNRFLILSASDPAFVPTLLTTFKLLGLAGRFDEAKSLRAGLIGTLLSTATELYQEKRYKEAIPYLDEALTGRADTDRDALLLKAKCLAYLGNLPEARALGDQLVSENLRSPRVLRDRGRIEFIDKQWDSAISFFEKAITLRRNNAQLWADIAQARIRMEKWDAAGAAAKMAIDQGGDTPYTLNLYSQVLEKQGRLEDAVTMMARAVRHEPRNPAYRHRLGRIALLRGNRDLALQEFETSVSIDPKYMESWLSLASVRADLRDFEGASEALSVAESLPRPPVNVIENVRAKICLIQDKLEEAQKHIDLALARRRDVSSLTLAIRIHIAKGEARLVSVGQARASIRLIANELDSLGHLRDILELHSRYENYF